MAHEEFVMAYINQVVISDKHTGGDYAAHRGLWTPGVSSVNNFYKTGCTLVDAGRLERGDGYFRLPGCKSEYKEHSQLVTKALTEILKLNYETTIKREITLNEIALRPDSIILLKKDNQKLCFILEISNNEFPEFLQQKVNAWRQWDGALHTLSLLFETKIKEFDIVVSGNISADGTFNLNNYMEGIKNV